MTRTTILATPALLASLICIAAPAGAASRGGGQSHGGTSVGRATPRAGAPRGTVGRVAPRIVGRAGVVAPYGFARPYYTFRPRVSLGLGLWAGFPVAYPYYSYGCRYFPSARYPYVPKMRVFVSVSVSCARVRLSFVWVSAGELSPAASGLRRRAARTGRIRIGRRELRDYPEHGRRVRRRQVRRHRGEFRADRTAVDADAWPASPRGPLSGI